MRILLVNYEFPPVGGGAGRACWHLCQELAKLGIHVDVVTSQGEKTLEYRLSGAHIYSLPTHRKNTHQTGIQAMFEFLVRAFFVMRKRIRENHYDLVHYFFSIPTGLLSFFVARDIPFMVSLRGGDVPGYNPGELQIMHKFLSPVNRLIWRKARAVVALSQDLGKFARQTEPALRYDVIYNGVDTAIFQPFSKMKNRDSSPVRLLTVARLLECKGIQYLLEALCKMEKGKFHLSVVGTGYFEKELRKRTASLNLQDSVSFQGAVNHNDLPRIYNHADIFVLPSYGDSFGQVFTEAMACGLPIIAARSGGVQEFVENGVNGFLVPPKNAEPLAEAICKLASAPDLQKTMGRNNIRKVRSRFGWNAIARQYRDVYHQILL